ncbi:VIT1/CCC1 transporter family protein [Microbacterium stercoris]|uniref:VIT1/CCC1 transporter family protein n=1 Tax=Microbacterium stercoris TaxID=2820289 RepID=A0A939QTM8_9MICO|nr:VIT1/CCC1 family protein [Microbacterium stercoris]MBO3662474.1 VIT1/CCC1 transporter family protein [Microbacterium stercoris]MBO3664466.1 VIT1/CCC1 transporter family protein [Microbacterium stercoris]
MSAPDATPADRRRWAQYLADERAEGSVYRRLASRKQGEERVILEQLAAAEGRHEAHWLALLGGEPARLPKASMATRLLAWMAGRFGTIFVLALAQNAEGRSPYDSEAFATPAMRADEKVHHEVVRGLAARGRRRLSGTFRAAVFGANDGLVSNLALILGIGAAGVSSQVILLSGIAGLLAGALSMGAGEFISVRSQRELLEATEPQSLSGVRLPDLDIDANELALVYRARGLSEEAAADKAGLAIAEATAGRIVSRTGAIDTTHEVVGGAWRAAGSSFLFFASGAIIPVLPWIFGLTGFVAIAVALVLVGIALMATGAAVGLLAGAPPLKRALRQLAIGFGAAAVTYVLGLVFGVTLG